MNIFAIFLLFIVVFLFFKLKISIYFKLDNFDTFIKIKCGFIEFKRKGSFVKRKRKYQAMINKTKKSKAKFHIKKPKDILKYIEINKLDINLALGTPFMFLTVFSVPVLATLFEGIKAMPFKKLENYSYFILPNYDEFKLFSEVHVVFKIRIFNVILACIFLGLTLRPAPTV